jgi:uncharacterized membrane protein YhiD involved in acid resistance
VIFRQRNSIKNLTTAASLWAVSAIGLASGVGDPTTAAVGTLVLLASLVVLRPVRTLVRRRWAQRTDTVTIRLDEGADPAPVVAAFDDPTIDAGALQLRKEAGCLVLFADVTAAPEALLQWTTTLAHLPGVQSIDE